MRIINITKTDDIREYIDLHILDPPAGWKQKYKYYQEICAFDIETTLISKYEQSVMYIWQFAINDTVIYGRTWPEFIQLLTTINECADHDRVIVYVHNLSYEFQFLKDIIRFDDIFAMDNRSILYAVSGNIEFRCSYKLSNRDLAGFIKSVGGTYNKVEGFNYMKKRYPWTALSEQELKYCIYDVLGLTDAIARKLAQNKDSPYTIPHTSTGYVRRIFRAELRPMLPTIRNMLPDAEVFEALRGAFRGGNTHAHRWNADKVLTDVSSWDISSSYPAVLLDERYPMKFYRGDPEYLGFYIKYDKAILLHITLYDLKLKSDLWGCPYIPKAKCEHIAGAEYDNGRVLEASSCTMWITEIDLQIIASEYDFKFYVDKCFYSDKKLLPQGFRKLLKSMYEKKTMLKGGDPLEYAQYKELINSVYGMTVQNPIKYTYVYDPDTNTMIPDESVTIEQLIKDYRMKGWLPYQWGVWCTAYARLRLEKGLRCIPETAFIYADTDSIKFQGNYDHNFEDLNKTLINDYLSAPDPSGKIHHIGIFEYEGRYEKFKTLGAKKYVYEDDAGVHITIAGVNKKAGAAEIKTIDNFKTGFKFRRSAGLQAIYNDKPAVQHIRIQGHGLDITSNVALIPTTYTIGITAEYDYLINYLMNTDIRESMHYER